MGKEFGAKSVGGGGGEGEMRWTERRGWQHGNKNITLFLRRPLPPGAVSDCGSVILCAVPREDDGKGREFGEERSSDAVMWLSNHSIGFYAEDT